MSAVVCVYNTFVLLQISCAAMRLNVMQRGLGMYHLGRGYKTWDWSGPLRKGLNHLEMGWTTYGVPLLFYHLQSGHVCNV